VSDVEVDLSKCAAIISARALERNGIRLPRRIVDGDRLEQYRLCFVIRILASCPQFSDGSPVISFKSLKKPRLRSLEIVQFAGTLW
jgi:hypothetical protein